MEADWRNHRRSHSQLEAAGVPCAPIQDLEQVVTEKQTEALGMIEDVPGIGLSLMGLPLSFDGVRPPIRRAAPRLGEHNRELRGTGDGKG